MNIRPHTPAGNHLRVVPSHDPIADLAQQASDLAERQRASDQMVAELSRAVHLTTGVQGLETTATRDELQRLQQGLTGRLVAIEDLCRRTTRPYMPTWAKGAVGLNIIALGLQVLWGLMRLRGQ